MEKEYKIQLSDENKKIAERFGLTEWFPGIEELSGEDDSMKDTIKELKDKGLEISSIYNGYQVTIIKAKDTEKEEEYEVFGETLEEAICNAIF